MNARIEHSSITATVFGKATRFVLVYHKGGEIPAAEGLAAVRLGFTPVGLVGLVGTHVVAECEDSEEARRIVESAREFFAECLADAEEDIETGQLEQLYRLPDERNEFSA